MSIQSPEICEAQWSNDESRSATSPICFSSARWYLGLTLSERINYLHQAGLATNDATADPRPAKQKLQFWHTQLTSDKGSCLPERLAVAGACEETLLRVLGDAA